MSASAIELYLKRNSLGFEVGERSRSLEETVICQFGHSDVMEALAFIEQRCAQLRYEGVCIEGFFPVHPDPGSTEIKDKKDFSDLEAHVRDWGHL